VTAEALLDSNVLVAAIEEDHEHHQPSQALLNDHPDNFFAVAAHSFAETYVVLTNPAMRAPYRWPAKETWNAIEEIAGVTRLVGLSHGASLEIVRAFAADGKVGPLLYDRLIGEAAARNSIARIITWNVRHMRRLFPDLIVTDPASFAAQP